MSGAKGAGLVTVQYGSTRGIGTSNVARFSQSTAGVAGAAEAGDGFGKAVATGDLDGDGYDDAIVGIPGEDLDDTVDAGGVAVLWGSKAGLAGSASDWLQTQEPTSGEQFGSGLAAAHFTGETPGDLLAVLDRHDLELFAYDAAPQARGEAPLRRQATERLPKAAEARRIQPKSLTTGDYDDNGYADLVVSGVTMGDEEPGHGWSAQFARGADGLAYRNDLRGGPAAASGDINNDGYDDLVTGEPASPDDGGETMTGGLVGVRYGTADGLADEAERWTQDAEGVPGVAERGDGWGADLSVADTNGDGYADVAIGAPGEDIGTVADAGAVWVLRGSGERDDGERRQVLRPGHRGHPGSAREALRRAAAAPACGAPTPQAPRRSRPVLGQRRVFASVEPLLANVGVPEVRNTLNRASRGENARGYGFAATAVAPGQPLRSAVTAPCGAQSVPTCAACTGLEHRMFARSRT
ncbi:hypothetical protein SALBM135S_07267 [Streptomyces alboniger]